MDGRRTDTRQRIRAVAIELFTEQGYDRTSMREIAERVDVTKAALYYHFPTKQDIVDDLFAAVPDGIEEIVEWARTQPPGPRTRDAILVRYGRLLHDVGRDLARFFYTNQTTFSRHPSAITMREGLQLLTEQMIKPDHQARNAFRARQALLMIGWSSSMMGDLDLTDEECFEAALPLARTVLSGIVEPGEL
ncbi:helix-turn-helix domain containing protein [Tsukamurella sp. 8F]|uniref:TetR/AcrR family transcriptional regulator n=1 Tax=unclassified Tsukamurella TaxID=2633480 RepID=UPI0023B99AD9|nr:MULTISPECIES: TetR/AcrR family transcriptional regulator [unclassified Tsukamurella]MDF0529684.1 helix-turn-helix domain containing protein [Tsukamurella sp. 8J]MDF0585969.1 helix-turn-helix domain containing protein [Tsukamurella sp. 8F]